MRNEDLYKQQPNKIYGDNLYIHLHIRSIGRMGDNDAKTGSEMAKIFQSYKDQVGRASKNQYIHLMKKSIQLEPKTNKLINEVLDIENNNVDKILNNIHTALQRSYEQQFDEQQISNLLLLNQKIDWTSSNKNNLNKLQNTLNDPANMEGFAFIDNILDVMAQACKLIKSDQGAALATVLLEQKGNYANTRVLGENLNTAMTQFIEQNNQKALTNEKINQGISIAKTIQALGTRLETNKNAKGKALSVQSIQGSIQKNFFPAISEVLATQINAAAHNAVAKFIASEAKISGGDAVLLQLTDEKGVLHSGEYFLADTPGAKAFGKADGLFNVDVNAESVFGNTGGQIKMQVGISSKAYATNQIGGKLDDVYEHFSLGKGFTLGLALKTMGLSLYDKYLAYNVLAKDGSSLSNALVALQDIILTRSIVYLASGRGAEDFSQLLLLNGKVMSMWDIIQYAIGNDIGKSSSMLPNLNKGNTSNNNDNGAYMSIPSRPDILKYGSDKSWITRIVETNKAIDKAVINLHIVPKKILDYSRSLTK